MTKTGFYRIPASLAAPESHWEYVSIPGLYRPAKYKASIDLGDIYVALTSVEKKQLSQGKKEQYEVLHFRAANPGALREAIEQAFPQAVFTMSDPTPSLKEQHQAEIKQERDRQAAADSEKRFEGDKVSEHRKIAAAQTREKQLKVSYANFSEFATNPKCSNDNWVKWFKDRPGFFSWPDSSWTNRKILLDYCEAHGWLVPLENEIAAAMNYLMNDYFYMKPSYKRSERDERAAVIPYNGIDTEAPLFTEAEISQAKRQLIEARIPGVPIWPVGSKPSADLVQARANALGISSEMLELIFGRQDPAASVSGKSATEAKAALRDMRNQKKPSVVRAPNPPMQEARNMSFDEVKKAAKSAFRIPDTLKGY